MKWTSADYNSSDHDDDESASMSTVYCPVLERKTYSLSMQKKVRFTDPFGVMMKLQKFVNKQNVA